ncbi:S53 family peptidase [Actinoplanes sp. NPDC023936]|uniref:S53 family peptidase n=1 Tax=Actinoplanes sp. NPDC023936 TaxID=3154910 RepID=UPI0033F33253
MDNRLETRMQMHTRPRPEFFGMEKPDVEQTVLDARSIAQEFGPEDGSGQVIALLEFGGRLDSRFVVEGQPIHEVDVTVHQARRVGDEPRADIEVGLGVHVLGNVVPRAEIVIFYAENTSAGFIHALATAIHDERRPSVICIPWGDHERSWTAQAMRVADELFAEANSKGMTICCASGNHRSADDESDPEALQVDFPASSPHVVACGGTMIRNGREVVWEDKSAPELDKPDLGSGGGESTQFARPEWQERLAERGWTRRAVPDLAGYADGYEIDQDPRTPLAGGTSAAAPQFAGVIARLNQRLNTRVGHITPLLYALPEDAFTDVLHGDNTGYPATPGWDACTGLGSPNGSRFLDLLEAELRRE